MPLRGRVSRTQPVCLAGSLVSGESGPAMGDRRARARASESDFHSVEEADGSTSPDSRAAANAFSPKIHHPVHAWYTLRAGNLPSARP